MQSAECRQIRVSVRLDLNIQVVPITKKKKKTQQLIVHTIFEWSWTFLFSFLGWGLIFPENLYRPRVKSQIWTSSKTGQDIVGNHSLYNYKIIIGTLSLVISITIYMITLSATSLKI